MTKQLQELRIVFKPDGVQYHVTYTHALNDKVAAGAGVAGRKASTSRIAREAIRAALHQLDIATGQEGLVWLGYSTNYVRTTDSIGVDR